MKLLVVAAVLAHWNYGEFVADPPAPKPSAAPHGTAAHAPAVPPPASAPERHDTAPAGASSRPPAGTAARSEAAPAALTPHPALWRLADSSGQLWEHADPAYLSRWVAERNRSLAAPGGREGPGPVAPPSSWTCTPGGCYPGNP